MARARYASGVGAQQAVIKVQAEITKTDTRLLDIAERRVSLEAQLNALRDRPAAYPLPELRLPSEEPSLPKTAELVQLALNRRPEITEAEALIERAQAQKELSLSEYRPDVTVGLVYNAIDERGDDAGRANPPEGNGRDVLGVSAGINLPVWRRRLAAGVEEATAALLDAEERRRRVVATVRREIEELGYRVPLIDLSLIHISEPTRPY